MGKTCLKQVIQDATAPFKIGKWKEENSDDELDADEPCVDDDRVAEI